MTPGPRRVPHAIERRDAGVAIDWDGVGHHAVFPARDLRLACPCAQCVQEMTGRPLLDPARVPADVRPVRLELVGAYGVRIDWSDGHSTGIYTYDRLAAICPCARCSPGV